MPLTESRCKRAVCPPEKARVRLADSGGLYLELTPTGSKLWRWKYRFEGKERRMALGAYPAVSLEQARADMAQAREVLHSGVDPVADRAARGAAHAHRQIKRAVEAVQAFVRVHQGAQQLVGSLRNLPPPMGPGTTFTLIVDAPQGYAVEATTSADRKTVSITINSKDD
jgi:hypothetical protein